ncbi:MAG: hypothetical protein IJ532_03270 [Alphaproteobacteria bacterium]|nr:hypothetical protein [Alphaproteobacteria bacterium]
MGNTQKVPLRSVQNGTQEKTAISTAARKSSDNVGNTQKVPLRSVQNST